MTLDRQINIMISSPIISQGLEKNNPNQAVKTDAYADCYLALKLDKLSRTGEEDFAVANKILDIIIM